MDGSLVLDPILHVSFRLRLFPQQQPDAFLPPGRQREHIMQGGFRPAPLRVHRPVLAVDDVPIDAVFVETITRSRPVEPLDIGLIVAEEELRGPLKLQPARSQTFVLDEQVP